MGRNPHTISSWWLVLIVLISVSTLTESRLISNPHAFKRFHAEIQPEVSPVKQWQSAEHSVRPRPIVVKCFPDSMEVVVQADMFSMGPHVDGTHLRLGSALVGEGSPCRTFPSGEDEFTIKAQLMDCGTKLKSTKEKIVYSNVLVYSPVPSSNGLLRLDGATIPVECHYEKRHVMDAISLHPAWVPFVSRVSAEDQIEFNLRIMTDDWQSERGFYTYFLGDPIHFEASVITANHMPLRVYVDQCVATATPDAEATLRYTFINNNGCLADAYLTSSSSHFLPRVNEHTLRFQLDAFRFYQGPSNLVYIVCYMKAVSVTSASDPQNKACSLSERRWRSVDGNDWACRSCDIYPAQEPLSTEHPKTAMITKAWSTMAPHESFTQKKPEQQFARYVHFRPRTYESQVADPHQFSATLMRGRGVDDGPGRTIQLKPLIVLASSDYVSRPADSKTILSPKNKIT